MRCKDIYKDLFPRIAEDIDIWRRLECMHLFQLFYGPDIPKLLNPHQIRIRVFGVRRSNPALLTQHSILRVFHCNIRTEIYWLH